MADETNRIDRPVATPFDYVTVACFLLMAGAFFLLTEGRPQTLLHLLLVGITFAIANQLGNADHQALGAILIVAGVAYAAIIIRAGSSGSESGR